MKSVFPRRKKRERERGSRVNLERERRGEARRDVIRYIKQEGAPSIELCPRERLVSEPTGQVDACERACAPAYRNSPLETCTVPVRRRSH